MRNPTTRGLAIVSVAIGAMALGLAAVGRGGAMPQDDAAKPAAKDLPVQYYAAKDCARCHVSNREQKPEPNFVKHTEYSTWIGKDKHSDAMLVLLIDDDEFRSAKQVRDDRVKDVEAQRKKSGDERALSISPKTVTNDLAKRMHERLPWDFARDSRCTSCHAPAFDTLDKDAQKAFRPSGPAEGRTPAEAAVIDGVTCVACHGPHAGWVEEHAKLNKEEDWIAKTAASKQDEWGLSNLRDPQVRTQMCASCHVGDAKQGRVVTHEIYAAGHPPLPGLEVATFSEAEPPHWWPLKDVPYLNPEPRDLAKRVGLAKLAEEKKRFEDLRAQYGAADFPTQHAKLVAVGGLVTFGEQMRLNADLAASEKGMPDFARFDCAACHHELRVSDESFRQARGFPSDPGRPPAAQWPSALAFVGLDPKLDEARLAELNNGLAAFHSAVGEGPFGNRDATVAAAKALSEWSNKAVTEVAKRPLDREAAIRMLGQIADSPVPDHASARQLAWSFRTIYNELNPKLANDPEITATIDALIKSLGIQLLPGDAPGKIEREIGARLDADERFKPRDVETLFTRLKALLK